jgi:beta-glucosidase
LNFPGTDEVRYREGIYVGYRYYDKKDIRPLFPFGHGLSYTKFEYSNFSADKASISEDEILTVTADVKNVGKTDGYETAQLYVGDVESTIDRPLRELKGFEKVFLKAGEKKTVMFSLDSRAFSYWDENSHKWTVESGKFELYVGPSSVCLPLRISVDVKSLHPPVRFITRYSTMGEVMAIPEGREYVMKMFAEMAKRVGIPMPEMSVGPDGMPVMPAIDPAVLERMPPETANAAEGAPAGMTQMPQAPAAGMLSVPPMPENAAGKRGKSRGPAVCPFEAEK